MIDCSDDTGCRIVLQLLGLLSAQHFLIFRFKLLCELICAPLDALDAHLVVAITLLEVSHTHKDRVLHLFLLLFDFFVQLRVQHLEGRSTVALALHWAV